MSSRYLIICHSPCLDGLGARWVINEALGEENCEHVPGVYGQDPPDVEGREVILADFTYKRPVMEKMLEEAKSVLVLDHHVSARENLKGVTHPNLDVVFDMERSGAGIAWDYFFPRRPRPKIIDFVEDNDLWRFSYEETKYVVEQIRGHPETMETFDRFVQMCDESLMLNTVVFLGKAIVGYKEQMVDHAIGMAELISFDGYEVWAANVPYFLSSETANKLICRDGEVHPFGVTYYRADDGMVRVSLRSEEREFDVSELAVKYGGGGHPTAAGFVCGEVPWRPKIR